MASDKDNKTEHPTQRKLQKAKEKGQVARSKEVPSAAVLLGMLLLISYFSQNFMHMFEFQMKELLNFRVPSDLTISYLARLFNNIGVRVGAVVVPALLAAFVISIGSNVMQAGVVISWEAIGFHFEKLLPKSGIGRIFSKRGMGELVKSLALFIAVSIISYQVVSKHTSLYPQLVLMDAKMLLYWTSTICYEVFIRVAVLLVILAIADYYFQRRQFVNELKMTKQEIKDEFKETEGDPTTKGRIRRVQREMSRKRMMADVPNADVVITNPTHYSIALSYNMDTMAAPKVIAKGVGFLALKIRELAQEHNIPLVENRPLAQALYKSVEIGDSIPAELYKAVAEILAYVYKARNAWSAPPRRNS